MYTVLTYVFKRNVENFVIISISVSTCYLVVLLVFTFVFHLEVVMVSSNTLVFAIFSSPSSFMSYVILPCVGMLLVWFYFSAIFLLYKTHYIYIYFSQCTSFLIQMYCAGKHFCELKAVRTSLFCRQVQFSQL